MCGKVRTLQHTQSGIVRSRNLGNQNLDPRLTDTETLGELLMTIITSDSRKLYKARHAHKRLYTVLPKYSKIQVLPGITSCRLMKDNKQAIELDSLLINNMPKDGYG